MSPPEAEPPMPATTMSRGRPPPGAGPARRARPPRRLARAEREVPLHRPAPVKRCAPYRGQPVAGRHRRAADAHVLVHPKRTVTRRLVAQRDLGAVAMALERRLEDGGAEREPAG